MDDATKQAVIHDRLMLDTGHKGADDAPPTYAHKESLTIHYSPANAPRIERHGQGARDSGGSVSANRTMKK